MRPYSLALAAFAVTLVRTTQSLATPDTRAGNISLPDSVRSFNGSLGDLWDKVSVGGDEDATGEARTLDMVVSGDVRAAICKKVIDMYRTKFFSARQEGRHFDQQALELQLSMEPGTNKDKINKLHDILHSGRQNKNGDKPGLVKARDLWNTETKKQAMREQKMRQHDLHPYELIEMVILKVKINAARIRLDKNGEVARGPRPNPFVDLELEQLEKYVKGYNKKHKEAFTLAGALWKHFGDVHDIVSFVSMAYSREQVEIITIDISATQGLMVKGWQQVHETLPESMSREDFLKHQNVVPLIEFTLAFVHSHPSRLQAIQNRLKNVFAARAILLIEEVEKLDLTLGIQSTEGKKYKIVDRPLSSKRTAAVLTEGAEKQEPKRSKKSGIVNPSLSAEESTAAILSPTIKEPNAANPSSSVEKSDAANSSPSVRRVPVLHNFFVR